MAYRSKSISLNHRTAQSNHISFADWQAKQKSDSRTPSQRGISVGSTVMWRYMKNNIIITDRAVVTAIDGETLTLAIRDLKERTGTAHLHEIVSSGDDRLATAQHELDKR